MTLLRIFLLALSVLPGLTVCVASRADAPQMTPVRLRYEFAPGQTLRYLVMRDPGFEAPAEAMQTVDPDAVPSPPIVERLTQTVQSVAPDGTATIQVTVAPEPGFEDEDMPLPTATQTLKVSSQGQVLTTPTGPLVSELTRTWVLLPAGAVLPGTRWKGPHGETLTLAALRGTGPNRLAVITCLWLPRLARTQSPDHDGTLLQTVRGTRADRIVFSAKSGQLVRLSSALTQTVSVTITNRGRRGIADFGRVVPNAQTIETLTVDRRDND